MVCLMGNVKSQKLLVDDNRCMMQPCGTCGQSCFTPTYQRTYRVYYTTYIYLHLKYKQPSRS